jgi:hypothetical protein
MIEFFEHNYQWIFSGIGVSILTLFFFVIKGIIKRKQRGEQSALVSDTKNLSDINTRTIDILPKTIIEEIAKYPPLQRKQIEESYKGIKVEWTTIFNSANLGTDGSVHLMLYPENSQYPWIYCDVMISEYPELRIIREGSKITVAGEIKKIHYNTITIKPSYLKFNT